MITYDILFAASTYKSVYQAVRFLKSSRNIGGRNLMVLVGPDRDELSRIKDALNDYPGQDYAIIHTTVNSLHFGRAWAFAWANANDLSAYYYCSCDDDLEWIAESIDIPHRLDYASSRWNFSLMGLNSSHPRFPTPYNRIEDKFIIDGTWMDGNCIFSHWGDNLEYGVLDALHTSPMSYYVEVEYAARLRYLTGRPLVFDLNRDRYYLHHFRDDATVCRERSVNSGRGMEDGGNFYKYKYGIDANFLVPGIHENIVGAIAKPEQDGNMKRHMIFEGLWNDWDAIYNRYKDGSAVIGGHYGNA